MPMNPRLLRPRQTGGDPDALRYIAAVQAADGQPLEAGVSKAISKFVIGCKTDGIWTAIKSSCILMGARTLNGALVPLVGAAPTNNGPFVSADYNRKTGLIGNNSNKYLNANRNGDADPQDNFHMSVYVTALGTSTFRHLIGHGGGQSGAAQIAAANATSNFTARNRSSAGSGTATGVTAPHFLGHSRAASGSYTFRFSSTNNTNNTTSQAPNASPIYVFANSSDGSAIVASGSYTNARLAWYSIGESVTMSSLESRVATLYADIGAAIP